MLTLGGLQTSGNTFALLAEVVCSLYPVFLMGSVQRRFQYSTGELMGGRKTGYSKAVFELRLLATEMFALRP